MRLRSNLKWILAVALVAYAVTPAGATPGQKFEGNSQGLNWARIHATQACTASGCKACGNPSCRNLGGPGFLCEVTCNDAASSPAGTVSLQQPANLNPPERLLAAKVMVKRMQDAAAVVGKQLAEARKSADVIKANCLSDNLSQANTTKKSGEERLKALEAAVDEYNKGVATFNEALKKGADAEANHQFTVLSELIKRVDDLRAQANQCIGQDTAFIGETNVKLILEGALPPSDQTAYPPTDPTLISAPPQCTSCTL